LGRFATENSKLPWLHIKDVIFFCFNDAWNELIEQFTNTNIMVHVSMVS